MKAMHSTTLSGHGSSGSNFQPLQGIVLSLFGAVATYLRRRRACALLMSMDDRQLRDIGVNRSEIPYVVCGRQKDDAAPVKWIAVDKRAAVLS